MKNCINACGSVSLHIGAMLRHGLRFYLGLSLFFVATSAAALGIGEAQVESHIGERLRVVVPLSDLSDPESLKLNVNHLSQGATDTMRLNANLLQDGGAYTVLINTDRVVKEPFLEFSLVLEDQQLRAQRDFTVLLNLGAQVNLGTQDAAQSASRSVASEQGNSGVVAVRGGTLAVMGPYEWAEAGNIASKFGAVLDGQSLWRVARRINQAMGVSVDQMMIALYESNPDAFASESIDSLQAGSYLTIPDYQFATRLTERQAQARVASLSGSPALANNTAVQSSTPVVPVAEATVPVEESETAAITALEAAELQATLSEAAAAIEQENSTSVSATAEQATAPIAAESSATQFAVTDIDSSSIQSPLTDGSQAGAQSASGALIDSLSASVTNLTQELYNKDRRIKALEDQIVDLQQAQEAALAQNAELMAVSSTTETRSISYWWLLPFALLAIFAYLFRDRINQQLIELNLFGRNEKLRFKTGSSRQPVGEITGFVSQNDYSNMSALEKPPAQDEVNGVSMIELDQLEDEVDMALAESVIEKDREMEFSEVDFDDDSEFTIDFYGSSENQDQDADGEAAVAEAAENKANGEFEEFATEENMAESADELRLIDDDEVDESVASEIAETDPGAVPETEELVAAATFTELEELEGQPEQLAKEPEGADEDVNVEPSDKLIFADDTDRLQVNMAEVIAKEAVKEKAEEPTPAADAIPPARGEAKQSTDEELEFSKRIDKLLAQRDYRFARELIDFARYNDISDDRYHYERMRLCLAMDDQDAFYDYYFDIESQIGNFDADLQIGVADLISRLGQYH